jgi:hypothetical protein
VSYESLGACGGAASYDSRAVAELELGIAFLKAYVGEPPSGYGLEIVEQEHELGVYATICLCWEIGSLGSDEWNYYRRCEQGLTKLDDAVSWSDLAEVLFLDGEEADLENDCDSENEVEESGG